MALVATLMSECANGNVGEHPWPMMIEDDHKLVLLALALANIPYFCLRAADAGVSQEPYFNGTAYLLLTCLQVRNSSRVVEIIRNTWTDLGRDDRANETVRRHLVTPVLNVLSDQLRDVCVDDCRRVMMDATVLSKGEIGSYWMRLTPRDHDRATPLRRAHLIVEDGNKACKVGLQLTTEVHCPLVHFERDEDKINIEETLTLIQMIVRTRGPKLEAAGTS
jgi:hypothetical protein